MATKRDHHVTGKQVTVQFDVKAAGGNGEVYIEGLANKAIVDRGMDLIEPSAWKLDNYKKNPVIFFNHNTDWPIGRAVDVKTTDQGLYVKVMLSNSKDPEITKIRDLVQERILRSFSVGFEPGEESKAADGGHNVIKSAELFEISIVGVPMNQDSTFELSSKSVKKLDYQKLRGKVLRQKGSWVAATVHDAIYNMEADKTAARADLLKQVMDAAKIDAAGLNDILAGNVTPIPEPVLQAFADVLKLKIDDLKKLDAGDVAAEGGEDESGDEANTDPNEGKEPAASEPPPPAPPAKEAQTDFQKCVSEKIRLLIGEGKDQDQAVAEAISHCQVGKACAVKPTKSDYKMFFDIADGKQAAQDGVTAPTTPVQVKDPTGTDYGNPVIDLQKQTNILLGSVVAELQKLNAGVQKLIEMETTEAAEDQTEDQGAASNPPGSGDASVNTNGKGATPPAPPAPPAEASLIPTDKMSADELKAAQAARAKKYGIEVTKDGALTFPKDYPTELEKYADPVNLKYPVDSVDRANNARVRFKQDAATSYSQDSSRKIVHNRIVSAQLALGAKPTFDPKDALDAMLDAGLQAKLEAQKTADDKAMLDYVEKRLENLKLRLTKLGYRPSA